MGRKSIKKDKSIYQMTREKLGLTREMAADLVPGLTAERIEKIENGRSQIHPEDVLLLSKYYKAPILCNYYCAIECPMGQIYALHPEPKNLGQIAIETLNAMNKMNQNRDRLLEIAEDGQVRPDEYNDFVEIKSILDSLALSVANLQLWVNQQIADGKMKKPE